MTDTIKDIQTQLRRSMNGVVSTSMREQGVDYKLNFGVALPKIKEIANQYTKSETLANTLWKEDVRELKILATLLYPKERFSPEEANQWVRQIKHQEIAEQFCRNLLQEFPFAGELASEWICQPEEYVCVTGFLLYARLCTNGFVVDWASADNLLWAAKAVMDKGVSRRQRAALLALKRYGRQHKEQAEKVLNLIEEYASSEVPEKQEFYHDIKFEFDYHL